jgi:valyl-tRNA synthetase
MNKGYFKAEEKSTRVPYSVILPPPNVTGQLHLGHALNHSIQDLLVRWKRMQGFNVLWMPGTDHAGIATQSVVERELKKEGKTRHDLGREKFVERVWEWKEQYGGRIVEQMKRLGDSCDWDRLTFTLDEGVSQAVRKVFVDLYKKDMIYKGLRLINWSPRSRARSPILKSITKRSKARCTT